MLVSAILSILAVTASSLASCSPTPAKAPAAPATKYLFTVNIASPNAYVLGDTPAGGRVFEPITGGNFSGPAAHGTFFCSTQALLQQKNVSSFSSRDAGKVINGVDYGMTDAKGYFDPDVVYLLQTSDASPCDILVREKGHAPNVFLLFETACDKYEYLNGVVAYGLAAEVTGGISVEVFSVSPGPVISRGKYYKN